MRNYLYEIRGEKCEVCGWDDPHPVLGRPLLQIDHIDGNDQNNVIDNLKILCPNHHVNTLTWGFVGREFTSEHRAKISQRKRNLPT